MVQTVRQAGANRASLRRGLPREQTPGDDRERERDVSVQSLDSTVFVARQPIFGRDQNVFAYELLFRSGAENAYDATDPDASTLDVITNSLLDIGLDELTGRKRAFINFTRNLLLEDVMELLPKDLVTVEILEDIEPDQEVMAACRRLKDEGYLLALDDFVLADSGSAFLDLADIVKADQQGRIAAFLRECQIDVMDLVDNRYLFKPFWLGLPDADNRLAQQRRRILRELQVGGTTAILQELFERLYVLRSQIFHGAATAESKLNRDAVERGARTLGPLVSLIVQTVIEAGAETDWGDICFPPCNDDER